jgi:hypothetical protein
MSLQKLVGTWRVDMRHVALEQPAIGRHSYEQVLDGAFVLLRATNEHPEVPDAMSLLTGSTCHYFDVRGVARTFDLTVDDEGWQIIRRDPDFWQRSSVRFVGADAMEGAGDNSHDGGVTWQHDFSITYTRT